MGGLAGGVSTKGGRNEVDEVLEGGRYLAAAARVFGCVGQFCWSSWGGSVGSGRTGVDVKTSKTGTVKGRLSWTWSKISSWNNKGTPKLVLGTKKTISSSYICPAGGSRHKRSEDGLVFIESAVELAMETSRVESAVPSTAEISTQSLPAESLAQEQNAVVSTYVNDIVLLSLTPNSICWLHRILRLDISSTTSLPLAFGCKLPADSLARRRIISCALLHLLIANC
ncbi:hypothetical protein F511_31544 [Dorcoceras hygrometricum]|uniref:Uncharacterized protein n=1 Tax=Dorcoceras hygrometricum TaxID=472368 RepID=A0A2Z7BAH2_9LAMI|nr:hypothetical protein F511_31544 [Dorcoceras hygrometricum]